MLKELTRVMANSETKIYKKLPFEIVDRKEDDLPLPFPSVYVGPKKYLQHEIYKEYGLDIYNFEARPDDVYLLGAQRTGKYFKTALPTSFQSWQSDIDVFRLQGTTLHCEMTWLIGNDLNFEAAKKDFLHYRFPHIDHSTIPYVKKGIEDFKVEDASDEIRNSVQKYKDINLDSLAKRTGRRFIRSHLPISLMPPSMFDVGAKVIYCARNPKDMLVSLYYAYHFFTKENFGFESLFPYFKHAKVWNGPYFEHVKEAWERRNDKNFLFLFYEDSVKDKRQTIRKIADFLDKALSEEQIDSLEEHLKISNFKKNKSVNNDQLIKLGLANDNGYFIREGRTGGWRDFFDKKLNDEFDQLIEDRLKGTDLRFPET